MMFFLGLITGLSIAFIAFELLVKPKPSNGTKMKIQLELDATQPVNVSITATDAEGNPVDAGSITDGAMTLTNVVDDLGTLTPSDANVWVFNPGTLGATGTIDATATIGGVAHEASADITLKAGAATDIGLKFTPVA